MATGVGSYFFVGAGAAQFPQAAPNGTAASPSYGFLNSPGTGIYSPGANQLGFSTNGIAALTFDAGQNAAFAGTINATLDIQGRYIYPRNGIFGIGAPFAFGQWKWLVNTQTASYTLTPFNDASQVTNNTAAGAQVVLTLPTSAATAIGVVYPAINDTTFGLQLKCQGTDKIRFPGSDSSAGGTQTTTTVGASVMLVRVSYGWAALGAPGGTWTAA
jgi:hypothetical protein